GGGHVDALRERRACARRVGEPPELCRGTGGEDRQVRTQPRPRGRRIVQAIDGPRRGHERREGRVAARPRRESGALPAGRVLPGAGRVAYKVSFSSYLDETAAASDLILPDLHPLEQWNDSRPRAGVYALQQPVMKPVFPTTRHTGDVLLQASGKASSFKDYLQTRWRTLHQRYGRGRGFDDFWSDAVQHGGVYGDVAAQTVRLVPGIAQLLGGL